MYRWIALPWVGSLLLFPAAAPLDVPFVREVRAGCGSAAVAMVMQYWVRLTPGLDSSAADAERIDKTLPASSKGLSGLELKQHLERHGFSAFLFSGEPADLRHHIEKGRPVVVCLGMRGARGLLHFVVIVGIEDNAVILNDPGKGKLIREPLNVFMRYWGVTGHWALLAMPRQGS